ncbi:hypothetical protein SLEP1_g25509 [Rubroshorea leprosula]|uniref:Uncharacterized protein n=1 Tax=Rubroshorea leprosula TaxID=152421 RepID=A0AAV5JTL9_9ROSI|nr:hypothetical protein SLEP1_g25509 [Rubroshorea leprosula]
MAPAVYITVVLFSPCLKLDHLGHLTKNVPRISQHHKTSLSETLTRFYPFAGKIKDHVSIECNGNGAHFVEAQCHCHLFDILQKPDTEMLQKFFPVVMESITGSLLQVQVTFFGCGGMAMGKYVFPISSQTHQPQACSSRAGQPPPAVMTTLRR